MWKEQASDSVRSVPQGVTSLITICMRIGKLADPHTVENYEQYLLRG